MNNISKKRNLWIIIGILIITSLLFFDLVHFIGLNSCSLPVGEDQWGYYRPIYEKMSTWEGFFYQQGSHFLGVGYFTSLVIGWITGFNVGAEGYLVLTLMVVNLILALEIRRKISGNFQLYDLFLPVLFLNSNFSVLYLYYAHGSVAVLPLMSILLFANILLMKREKNKMIYLGILFFMSAFTGYAFITSFLIAIYTLYLLLKRTDLSKLKFLLLLQTMTFFLFVSKYDFSLPNTTACVLMGEEIPYLQYTVNLVRGFLRATLSYDPYLLLLGMLIPTIVAFFNKSLWLLTFKGFLSLIFLMSFTFLYVLLNVNARACFGVNTAYALRYGFFPIPAILSVYFVLTSGTFRNTFVHHVCALLFVFTFSFFRFRVDETFRVHQEGIEKRSQAYKAWYKCYNNTPDWELCTSKTGVMPLKEKDAVKLSTRIDKMRSRQRR